MGRIYHDITELIGRTPLLALERYSRQSGLVKPLYGKLEGFNPAGSVKDRVALSMIRDAEEKGLLKPGSIIIEPTSGNTGIGLASVAMARGYKVILTMPETMSVERRSLLKAYGAEVVLTEGAKGMRGAIEKAEKLAAETPGSFIPGQFDNQANPNAHRRSTGPEIWEDTNGMVDIFVAGAGTGGTLTGVGEYLKGMNPAVQVVAVEPEASQVLAGKPAGPHGLMGMGANFIPKVLNTSIYDEVIAVKEADAYEAARNLVHSEGVLIGISSGAALWAALQIAKRPENRDRKIVVLFPDGGERYLSTALFSNTL